jgi:hypothetical protein
MTDKVDTLIWFYDDKGRIKNMKLQKFLNCYNKNQSTCNSAQNYYATKKLAIKNNWVARSK